MNEYTRDDLLALHEAISTRCRDVMRAKNHDYAGASGSDPFGNFKACESIGVCTVNQGFLVRMLDKFKRLTTFAQSGTLKVANESFADACYDIINYCILFAGANGLRAEDVTKKADFPTLENAGNGHEPPASRRPTVYLCGPITGADVDRYWRSYAIGYLSISGLDILDPMEGKDAAKITGNGLEYDGQLADVNFADQDMRHVDEADAVLCHFPYTPTRQSIGSLMELGRAAGRKPIAFVGPKEMADHLFLRRFVTICPDLSAACGWCAKVAKEAKA